MKNVFRSIVLVFAMLIMNTNIAQNKASKCKVISEDMVGVYKGGCKNGLANGKGQLVFENGLLMYIGSFKEGKLNGKGEMIMLTNGVKNTINKGVWVDNVFQENESNVPYVVRKSINLDRYTIRKIREGNMVKLNFYQNGSPQEVRGLSIYTNNGTRISNNNVVGYENIIFPFIIDLRFLTSNKFKTTTYDVTFEMVINEPGSWEITLKN